MSGNEGSDVSCATDLVTTKTTFTWKIKGLDEETCQLHDLQGIKTEEFTIKVPGHRDSKGMMEPYLLQFSISPRSRSPFTVKILEPSMSSSVFPLEIPRNWAIRCKGITRSLENPPVNWNLTMSSMSVGQF